MKKMLIKKEIEKALEKIEEAKQEIELIQFSIIDATYDLEEKDNLTEKEEDYLDWLNELDDELEDAMTNIDSIEIDKFID